MKIIDKINQLLEEDQTLFSFEYFPPKTDEGLTNLYQRIESMSCLSPTFIDVTWGAGGSTAGKTLEIVKHAQKYLGLETMMHLTCTNMPVELIDSALTSAKEAGVQNILALKGDPPIGEEWKKAERGFGYAIDLVKYIREKHGDYFCIGVAGYPETHADSRTQEEDLYYLKLKVEAGANLIITQLFYDTQIFIEFVKKCRAIGINCPIIPGIMPIHTYAGFKRMTTLCKTIVPQYILDALEDIKDNDEEVKTYGVKLAIEMCKTIFAAGTRCVHFYTLNLERSVGLIVEGLEIPQKLRPLPWRPSTEATRCKEDVRPIFWRHRTQSYIKRTETWDDFPNGRWGDSRSPAFGELTDFHLGVSSFTHRANNFAWSQQLNTTEDVAAVFVMYCEGTIQSLPWNELPLSSESDQIKNELIKLNTRGLLTINSQPRVNGVPSTDPIYGWGRSDGWVYQKAYVEFFVSEDNLNLLLSRLSSKKLLTYHAVNANGDRMYTNTSGPNALTWGVFCGREIQQPTIVDAASFCAWKDEAFSLWNTWANLYAPTSKSHQIIKDIQSNWFLMNIVDNDFQNGNIFSFFDGVLTSGNHSNGFH